MNHLANLPQTTTSTSRPLPQTPEFSRSVAFVRSGMTVHQDGSVTIANGRVSNAFRGSAGSRLNHLDRYLAPGPEPRVAAAVSRMLGMNEKRTIDDDTATEILRGWLAVLAPLPAWAVEDAALALARKPGSFAPSSGDTFAAAELLVAPYREERRMLALLLDANEEPSKATIAPPAAVNRVPYDPHTRPVGRFEHAAAEAKREIVPRTDEELRDRLGVHAPEPSAALASMMSRKTEDAA